MGCSSIPTPPDIQICKADAGVETSFCQRVVSTETNVISKTPARHDLESGSLIYFESIDDFAELIGYLRKICNRVECSTKQVKILKDMELKFLIITEGSI